MTKKCEFLEGGSENKIRNSNVVKMFSSLELRANNSKNWRLSECFGDL